MNHNRSIGQYGEDLATSFLIKRGYKILSRNVKMSYKEIDIIAEKNNCLVFVEVKTRAGNNFKEAVESLNDLKLHNIRRAAELFLYFHPTDLDARIDLIMINLNITKKIANIKHYPNIS